MEREITGSGLWGYEPRTNERKNAKSIGVFNLIALVLRETRVNLPRHYYCMLQDARCFQQKTRDASNTFGFQCKCSLILAVYCSSQVFL